MLVRDANIIKTYIPVVKTFTYNKLESALTSVELYLNEVISSSFYDELDTYFNVLPSPPVNVFFDRIIQKLQKSIVNLAYYNAFDILNAVFSDQGIHRIETEEGSKKALFQRQEVNIKEQFRKDAYLALDDSLTYMETEKANFPTWVASSQYTLAKRNFINTTAEFNAIYDISNSRLVFQKLRKYQVLAEDFDLLPAIGRAFFDELKLQIQADTLTPANIKAMPYIQKCIAYASVGQGAYGFTFVLDQFGYSKTSEVSNTANFKERTQAGNELRDIIKSALQNAEKYIKVLIAFLRENATDYPLYINSAAYVESLDRPYGTDKILLI